MKPCKPWISDRDCIGTIQGLAAMFFFSFFFPTKKKNFQNPTNMNCNQLSFPKSGETCDSLTPSKLTIMIPNVQPCLPKSHSFYRNTCWLVGLQIWSTEVHGATGGSVMSWVWYLQFEIFSHLFLLFSFLGMFIYAVPGTKSCTECWDTLILSWAYVNVNHQRIKAGISKYIWWYLLFLTVILGNMKLLIGNLVDLVFVLIDSQMRCRQDFVRDSFASPLPW